MNVTTPFFRYLISVFTLLFVSLMFFTVEYINKSYEQNAQAAEKAWLAEHLDQATSNIEANIYANLDTLNALSVLLTHSQQSTLTHWQDIAPTLLRNTYHAINLSIATNDVLTHVYPMSGNETVIGVDLRQVPSQNSSLEKIRSSKSVFIDGPLYLIQGGYAIIARQPIFNGIDNQQSYWGHASIVIDVRQLVSQAINLALSEQLDNYQVSVQVLAPTKTDVIYGIPTTFSHAISHKMININNQHWQMAITPKEQAFSFSGFVKKQQIRILGYTGGGLLLFVIFLMLNAYRTAYLVSLKDDLTQLSNRRYALSTMDRLIHSGKHNSCFTIVRFDIHHFKQINDLFGHHAGDYVLLEIGQRLTQALRSSDTIARIDGDEFLLILPRVHLTQEIESIKSKIYQQLQDVPFTFEEHNIHLSISLGIAIYPDQATESKALLNMTEKAIFLDKQRFRNNIMDVEITV